MITPLISVICPSIKNTLWEVLYKAYSITKIPFEIIFVGPNSPLCSFPSNFIHIKTNVKPMQCLEIAAREARGDWLFVAAGDDFIPNNYFLDWLMFFRDRIKNEKTIIAPIYSPSETNREYIHPSIWTSNKTVPMIGENGLVSRSLWKEFGGIDNRFIFWDGSFDIFFRFRVKGGDFFLSPGSIMDKYTYKKITPKRKNNKNEHLRTILVQHNKIDRKTLHSLWIKKSQGRKIFTTELRGEIQSYKDENILLKSQGQNLPEYWD